MAREVPALTREPLVQDEKMREDLGSSALLRINLDIKNPYVRIFIS